MSPPDVRSNAADDYDSWREPLLKSLRECGVQPASRWVVLRYVLAIFAFAASMVIAKLAELAIRNGLRTDPVAAMVAYGLLVLFGVAVLSRIRNGFMRRAWQSSARSAEQELATIGSRRPVFYLRSFALDAVLARPGWMERYLGTRPFPNVEQQTTAALRKIGPVVAIGRPGEKLPRLGAARFYVTDDLWKQKVSEIAKESQLVVWATGVTEGLGWEILHLVENLSPRRLIIWAHPHLMRASETKREAEWTRFRETLGGHFPKPLPEKLGDARYFIFDADWNPIPVAPRISDAFTTRQSSALRRALLWRQNGLGEVTLDAAQESARETRAAEFGSIIGARGKQPNWARAACFAAALTIAYCLAGMVQRLLLWVQFGDQVRVLSGSGSDLLLAAGQAAALVAAFRFIRNSFLATLAASAGVALLLAIRGQPLIDALLVQVVSLGVLVWVVQRSDRLFWGLWWGMSLASLLSHLLKNGLNHWHRTSSIGFFNGQEDFQRLIASAIIAATLFAFTFPVLLKTTRRWTGNPD